MSQFPDGSKKGSDKQVIWFEGFLAALFFIAALGALFG